MKRSNFNDGWRVRTGISNPFDAIFAGGVAQGEPVTLPPRVAEVMLSVSTTPTPTAGLTAPAPKATPMARMARLPTTSRSSFSSAFTSLSR